MIRRGALVSSSVLWLCIYLVLVLSPLFILLGLRELDGSGFWWDFSMALGFTAMAMMGIQFLLTARFKRITQPFGIDIIYYFHRYFAVLAICLLLLHYLILKFQYPDALGVLNPLEAADYLSAGRVALLLFVMMVITSLWRKQLHLNYDLWRLIHILFAVSAFLLALWHIEGVGYYIDAPEKRWLWSAYTLLWLCLIAYVRILKPWQMFKHPFKVEKVKQERGDACTLTIKSVSGEPFSFSPGQFAWLTLDDSPWHIREHPFSISSSSEQSQQIEFTIKSLGDFTSRVKETQPGTTAYIDGPYGIFSVDQYPQAPGFVFIAGGVGAAPIMSMLRSLADRNDKRPLLFIYANNQWQDVIFREELESLKNRLNIQLLHVIKYPHENYDGQSGYVTQELLSAVLDQDLLQYEYFLCGPWAMAESVQCALHALKVPLGNVHFELFDMV